LLLYATEDGSRPAGTVKTTDALITIMAGSGQTPARINIESGGELKLNGANIDINATGQMRLSSGSTFEIKSGADFLITSDNFTINKDDNGKYTVKLKGEVVADSGRIAGFTLREVYNGSTLDHRYLYSGDTANLNYSTASNYKGVYIGTDGVNFGGILKISSNGQTSELRMAASNIIIGNNNSLSNQITTLNTGISNAATAASNAATAASNAQTAANNARAVATGTKLKIDANAGTIEVSATSTLSFLANQSINITSGGTINLASGKELNLVTDGKIRIGHTSYPFVISKDNLGGPNGNINRSYIYAYNSSYASGNTRNVTSIRDVTTSSISYKGIYLGTDGINLGGKFRVDQDGKLTATSGTFSGDITGASGTFSGSITGATGTIGGWSITSAGISNGSITLGSGGTLTGPGFTLNTNGLTFPASASMSDSSYGNTVEQALTGAKNEAVDEALNYKFRFSINGYTGEYKVEPLLEEAFSRIMSIQNGNAKVGSLEYGPLLIGKGANGYVIGWSSSSGGFWVDYSGNVWAETLYLKDTTIHSW